MNIMLVASLLAQASEGLAGGAGWVGAGLLGSVLAWLLFFHLPAKDKLLMDLLQLQIAERKEDAERRHNLANQFTIALAEVISQQRASLADVAREQKEEIRYLREQFRTILAVKKTLAGDKDI